MKKNRKEIMDKIRKDELKMKPKWWFEGIRWGLEMGNWIIVLVASVFLAAGIFWIELICPIKALDYGRLGLELILSSLPLLGLGIMVFLLIAGVVIYKNRGENYKKSIKKIWIIIVLTVVLAAIFLTIFRKVFEPEILLRII